MEEINPIEAIFKSVKADAEAKKAEQERGAQALKDLLSGKLSKPEKEQFNIIDFLKGKKN